MFDKEKALFYEEMSLYYSQQEASVQPTIEPMLPELPVHIIPELPEDPVPEVSVQPVEEPTLPAERPVLEPIVPELSVYIPAEHSILPELMEEPTLPVLPESVIVQLPEQPLYQSLPQSSSQLPELPPEHVLPEHIQPEHSVPSESIPQSPVQQPVQSIKYQPARIVYINNNQDASFIYIYRLNQQIILHLGDILAVHLGLGLLRVWARSIVCVCV